MTGKPQLPTERPAAGKSKLLQGLPLICGAFARRAVELGLPGRDTVIGYAKRTQFPSVANRPKVFLYNGLQGIWLKSGGEKRTQFSGRIPPSRRFWGVSHAAEALGGYHRAVFGTLRGSGLKRGPALPEIR